MAVLQQLIFSPSLSSLSSPSSSFPTLAFTANRFRLEGKCFYLQPKCFNGVRIPTQLGTREQRVVIVRASSDIDGVGSGGSEQLPESEPAVAEAKVEESVSVENLPLESKLQLKMEQKLRMKLAKKIRLRRKRLVRKRQLRKKGRWPPSKMKKNKNV